MSGANTMDEFINGFITLSNSDANNTRKRMNLSATRIISSSNFQNNASLTLAKSCDNNGSQEQQERVQDKLDRLLKMTWG